MTELASLSLYFFHFAFLCELLTSFASIFVSWCTYNSLGKYWCLSSLFLPNRSCSLAIWEMSEVPDFHFAFFCSPDYYTAKHKCFYIFCALKILLESLGNFLLLLRPWCLLWTGICFYSRIWGFSSLLLSEDVKWEEISSTRFFYTVLSFWLLKSIRIIQFLLFIRIHAKFKKKVWTEKKWCFFTIHNSFSPLSIHQAPQLYNCVLYLLYLLCSLQQLSIHLQNSQMEGI